MINFEQHVVAKNTPLDVDASQLTVMSYNVLADIFVRPIDQRTGNVQEFAAFRWAEPAAEVLDWSARQPRIMQELKGCRADVISLQEVQFEQVDGTYVLPGWLDELEGYAAAVPEASQLKQMADRNERVLKQPVPVATALLYRTDRLVPHEVSTLPSDPNTLRIGSDGALFLTEPGRQKLRKIRPQDAHPA